MVRRMESHEYRIRFITPAFLGGADQSAQWRVPPIKSLLRQWWRVVWWNTVQADVNELRSAESTLFGSSGDEAGSSGQVKSRVRIRLDDWRGGTLGKDEWKRFQNVKHPEVHRPIGVDLYLGYGSVQRKDQASIASRCALVPDRLRTLRITSPANESERIHSAMKLIALFGVLGGRSRNGWGSLGVEEEMESGGLEPLNSPGLLEPSKRDARTWLRDVFSIDWRHALDEDLDWCHALGRDQDELLIWRTDLQGSWEEALQVLADAKIQYRTQFHFKGGGPHQNLCERQLLAYPVTNHKLAAWGDNMRSANQILFKVLPCGSGFCGLAVHLPHCLPRPLMEKLRGPDRGRVAQMEKDVWAKVHKKLDEKLTRLP